MAVALHCAKDSERPLEYAGRPSFTDRILVATIRLRDTRDDDLKILFIGDYQVDTA